MNNEMQYLLHLARCGACAQTPKPPAQAVDWQALLQLAYEQNVESVVTLALKKGNTTCPETLIQPLLAQLRGNAIKNLRRAEGWLALLEEARQQGIELLVIKGLDVARFYHNPECRVANDMDLLVRPQQEKAAFRFLQAHGFRMEERLADSNHAIGEHPVLGMVELHMSLVSERFERMFAAWKLNENAFDGVQQIEFSGSGFRALESTNALLFLSFHLIKHFLYNGISLKMMFDIALFAKNTLAAVDTVRYRQLLESGKFAYLLQTVFGTMVKYGGFEKEDFPLEPAENEADIDALLENIAEGGAMGKNREADVQGAWMFYYYDFATRENSREDLAIINTGQKKDFLSGLFPSVVVLSRKYPILLRKKWLYPFCWLHRLFTKGFAFLFSHRRLSRRKIKEREALSPQAQEKIRLLEQLRIVEYK